MNALDRPADRGQRGAGHQSLGGVILVRANDAVGLEVGGMESWSSAVAVFRGVATSRFGKFARLTIPRFSRALAVCSKTR